MRFYIRNAKDGSQELVTITDEGKHVPMEPQEVRQLMQRVTISYIGYDNVQGTGEMFMTFFIHQTKL